MSFHFADVTKRIFISIPKASLPPSIPGSTNTTTTAAVTTHTATPHSSHPPTVPPVTPTTAVAPPPYHVNSSQSIESVIPPQQPAKVKKGVKRKADTTTPTANAFESPYTAMESKNAKIATRRESGRQVNKVRQKRFCYKNFIFFMAFPLMLTT